GDVADRVEAVELANGLVDGRLDLLPVREIDREGQSALGARRLRGRLGEPVAVQVEHRNRGTRLRSEERERLADPRCGTGGEDALAAKAERLFKGGNGVGCGHQLTSRSESVAVSTSRSANVPSGAGRS